MPEPNQQRRPSPDPLPQQTRAGLPGSGEPPKTAGARTTTTQGQEEAAHAVREMFSSIAPRYDLLNHLLSFNTDRYWWWRASRSFDRVLRTPDASVLDLCCGTGDMAFSLARRAVREVRLTGADFSAAMLARARQKDAAGRITWVEADALHLPFADSSFDLVTSAFGFRNLANYDQGLTEICRVLKPGGEVGILDFGEPPGWSGRLYRFYFRRVLPRIGRLISGVDGAYAYLPASVARFPGPAEMLERMRRAGFESPVYTPYTFGIAGLYRARKA